MNSFSGFCWFCELVALLRMCDYAALQLFSAIEEGDVNGSLRQVRSVRHDFYAREDVLALRQAVGKQLQQIQQSGKVKELRAFADVRGGFMLVDVDSPSELRNLFGGAMLDHFHIETHPVTTVEELAEFFEQDAIAG